MTETRRTRWCIMGLPLASWAILAGVGYLPTRSQGGAEGIEAMLAAQALVTGIVYVTLQSALRSMVRSDAGGRFKIAFKAAAQRFVLTIALAGVVVWRSAISANSFLIWVAITYVVMINVETVALVTWMKKLEKKAC